MTTDYPLYAKKISISFECVECHSEIKYAIESLPSPNWEGDSVETSKNQDNYEFKCPNCKHDYEVDVFANIYYGELQVRSINDWKEINNIEVIEDWEQQETFESLKNKRSDLDMFLNNGTEFPIYLKQIIEFACYKSYREKKSFAVEDIVEERDDYRYSYMRGVISAMCTLHLNNPLICKKVISDSFWDSKTYYICGAISGHVLLNFDKNYSSGSQSKERKDIENYFRDRRMYYHFDDVLTNVNGVKNGIDISQTSLNDDILLYSLSYACYKGISSIPISIISENTPYYDVVEAFGFAEQMKSLIKNHFYCDFEASENFIKNIKIDKYFNNYDRRSLTEKYEKNQMYIDGVFDIIESKINDYCKLINMK